MKDPKDFNYLLIDDYATNFSISVLRLDLMNGGEVVLFLYLDSVGY